jgi:hypothetical protein
VRGREYELLDVFIGKWITEGHTVASPGASSSKITASDVYEWAAGGFFILHTAYGRIGDTPVGGIEIIGYDPARKVYRTHFFDSQGNVTSEQLTVDDGVWRWLGDRVRCTGRFSPDGRQIACLHERSDDGMTWVPSMEITITKAG